MTSGAQPTAADIDGVETKKATFVTDVRQKQRCVIEFLANYIENSEFKMNKLQEGLQQQRKIVEQLRLEAAVNRMRVSECIEDIKKFTDTRLEEDYLIKGFPRPGDNPFKEKGSCTIL